MYVLTVLCQICNSCLLFQTWGYPFQYQYSEFRGFKFATDRFKQIFLSHFTYFYDLYSCHHACMLCSSYGDLNGTFQACCMFLISTVQGFNFNFSLLLCTWVYVTLALFVERWAMLPTKQITNQCIASFVMFLTRINQIAICPLDSMSHV